MMSPSENAEVAIRMVKEAPELVYDTETSGVDWKRNFPVGYVVGADDKNVVYVPIRHGGGGNLPGVEVPKSPTDSIKLHDFEKELAKAFEERNRIGKGMVIGHHIKFDCHMSANATIMLGRNLSCTQNNEALLNEYSRSFSLDACAKAHDVVAKKGQDLYNHIAQMFSCPADKKSMAHYWRLSGNDPIAVDYAIGDGISTIQLFHSQLDKIIRQEMSQIYELENKLIWTLFRMERRGIPVDEKYLGRLKDNIGDKVKKAAASLPEGFNTRSPNDVKNWVTDAGRTDWPKTKKGNPSFKEKWLKKFPEGQLIVDLRKWTNLDNSFMTPLIEQHVWNGRVHCTLNQLKADDHGTVAGRLSCSNPNLQAAPKRDKEAASLIRRAYIADPGFVFYDADYSQCEPRLFGHYSKEPAILNGYNQEPFIDMHGVVAELLKVERDPTAKRMDMGILTGMWPKSFAEHMEWDIATATKKWNQWFEMFPGVKTFQENAKGVLRSRGYVTTLLGRRCRLESPRFAYRAVSKIIQGSNADIVKYFMLKLDMMCESESDLINLFLTIHDSFQWQSPNTSQGEEFSKALMNEMCKVQQEPFNLRVPFVVDSGSGENWARATFGDKATEFISGID